jgi:DNA-binding NarL/FixJ family response regulator
MNGKPQRKKGINVLIVDDHPMVRERLSQLVNEQPDLAVCGAVGDVRHALTAIEAGLPDILLIDLSLKGSSGMELIKDIHYRHPRLPVLVVSMHEESLFAERALRAGARGYVSKEEATDHVVMAIRRVLSGDVWLSERMQSQLMRRFTGDPPAKTTSEVERLTDREIEVFQMIGQGMINRHIADALHIDRHTVETYRTRIKEKLNLGSSLELLQHALQWIQDGFAKLRRGSSASSRSKTALAGLAPVLGRKGRSRMT